MGHVKWAESCRSAFCKYVTLTRRGPAADSKRFPDHKPSDLRPTDSAYWEMRGDHSIDIGRVFKYPYSYDNLLRLAGDRQLKGELEAKAYRLF